MRAMPLRRLDTVELDGRRVRDRRLARKLTQADLASQAGAMSRGYISVIETRAAARVSRASAEALADALGVSVASLKARGSEGGVRFGAGTAVSRRASRIRRLVVQLKAAVAELEDILASGESDR